MRFIAGDFYWPDKTGGESDTAQRQFSLDAASEGADWVLQLDTDEVVANPTTFMSCLTMTQETQNGALHFPLRWLFCHVRDDLYLESCGRLWQIAATYPGPVVVKAGSKLHHCRQTMEPHFRVDFKKRNTDPAHAANARIDRVIEPSEGIWHFSLVRSEEFLLRKAEWSTHAKDFSWSPIVKQWQWSRRHPILATMATPFTRRHHVRQLRLTRVQVPQVIAPPGVLALSKNGPGHGPDQV
jgi:hypothetical protein